MVSYRDKNNKRVQISRSTGLKADIPENRAKAEEFKDKLLEEWKAVTALPNFEVIPFSDFLSFWLEETKATRRESTNKDYAFTVNGVLIPYFSSLGVKLSELKAYHIQEFYSFQMQDKGVKNNTIHHYHAYIHKCLDYAVKMEYIISNPADKVTLPRKEKHHAKYIESPADIKFLLEQVKGKTIEPVFVLAIYLGLRRGEIAGLKWKYINFEQGTLSIRGTLSPRGEYIPETKNETSARSFPLSSELIEYLLEIKEKQEGNKKRRGAKYNTEWTDFVCVRADGSIMTPDFMTNEVRKICKKHGFDIKLHELRHTNISLLINSGKDLKSVAEWAGHSSILTTADIYAHISTDRKKELANSISLTLK